MKNKGMQRSFSAEMAVMLGGIFSLWLISLPLLTYFSEPNVGKWAGALILCAGLGGAAALHIGRNFSSSGALGGFAIGSVLKLSALTAIFFAGEKSGESPKAPLLIGLTVFFLFYIWTSYRFHVSSQG